MKEKLLIVCIYFLLVFNIYSQTNEPEWYLIPYFFGYINKEGEILKLPKEFRPAGSFSEGKACIRSLENYKKGYINEKGKIVIKTAVCRSC